MIVYAVSFNDLDARAPALASSPACAGSFAATAPSRPPLYISPQRFTHPCNTAVRAGARRRVRCAARRAGDADGRSAASALVLLTGTQVPQCEYSEYPSVSTPSTTVRVLHVPRCQCSAYRRLIAEVLAGNSHGCYHGTRRGAHWGGHWGTRRGTCSGTRRDARGQQGYS